MLARGQLEFIKLTPRTFTEVKYMVRKQGGGLGGEAPKVLVS